jgi:hypothetical protein
VNEMARNSFYGKNKLGVLPGREMPGIESIPEHLAGKFWIAFMAVLGSNKPIVAVAGSRAACGKARWISRGVEECHAQRRLLQFRCVFAQIFLQGKSHWVGFYVFLCWQA